MLGGLCRRLGWGERCRKKDVLKERPLPPNLLKLDI